MNKPEVCRATVVTRTERVTEEGQITHKGITGQYRARTGGQHEVGYWPDITKDWGELLPPSELLLVWSDHIDHPGLQCLISEEVLKTAKCNLRKSLAKTMLGRMVDAVEIGQLKRTTLEHQISAAAARGVEEAKRVADISWGKAT